MQHFVTRECPQRCVVHTIELCGSSLIELEDASIDRADPDAGQRHDFVSNELAVLNRKVTPAGRTILHDGKIGNVTVNAFNRFGVIQAAHEFMMPKNGRRRILRYTTTSTATLRCAGPLDPAVGIVIDDGETSRSSSAA